MNARQVLSIPLGNFDRYVSIYRQDYEELMTFGISPKWKYNQGHVWVRHNGKDLCVGRLILDAGKRQKYLLLDKNPLNLKRDNLVLAPGVAKTRTRDLI